MGFTVYNTKTHKLLVEVKDDSRVYIDPAFHHMLEKISPESCFAISIPGERDHIFGDVKEITKENPLYAKALKMYCKAQLLTHPETYSSTPN